MKILDKTGFFVLFLPNRTKFCTKMRIPNWLKFWIMHFSQHKTKFRTKCPWQIYWTFSILIFLINQDLSNFNAIKSKKIFDFSAYSFKVLSSFLGHWTTFWTKRIFLNSRFLRKFHLQSFKVLKNFYFYEDFSPTNTIVEKCTRFFRDFIRN